MHEMQRLNHHHLYIFLIFGKHLSFTKAAEELRIAQSAVTAQIRSLEDTLGLELVSRVHPRRPSLTPEGQRVWQYAENIFESSRELLEWAIVGGDSKNRVIKVGAISGLSRNLQFEFIQPLLGREGIKFEIVTGDQQKLMALLSSHQLDVILTSSHVSPEELGKVYVNVLTTSPLVFVAHRTVKLIKSSKSLSDLFTEMDLYTPGKYFEAKAELDGFLDQQRHKPRIAGEVDDIALLRIIALRAKSLVVIPEMGVKNDIESGELRVIGYAKNIQQRFYAITRTKLNKNSEIAFLIENLKKKN